MKKSIFSVSIMVVLIITIVSIAGCSSDENRESSSKSKTSTTFKSNDQSTASNASAQESVVIKTFMFDPDPVNAKVGTQITWTNQDNINHTVTSGTRDSSDGTFDGFIKEKGKTFSFTFEKAGTYEYFCEIHPGMDAKVIVS